MGKSVMPWMIWHGITLIHIYDVTIIDVSGVEWIPDTSPRKSSLKLLRCCNMSSCNIGNYLIECQSEWYNNNLTFFNFIYSIMFTLVYTF